MAADVAPEVHTLVEHAVALAADADSQDAASRSAWDEPDAPELAHAYGAPNDDALLGTRAAADDVREDDGEGVVLPPIDVPPVPYGRGDSSSAGANNTNKKTQQAIVGGSAPNTHHKRGHGRSRNNPDGATRGMDFEDREILYSMRKKAERHAQMNVRPWREASAVPALPPLLRPRTKAIQELDSARVREREAAWHGAHKTKKELGVQSTVWCARVRVRSLTDEERAMMRRRKEERIQREAARNAIAEAVANEQREEYEKDRAHAAAASSAMREAIRKARKEEALIRARQPPAPPPDARPAAAPRRKVAKRVMPIVSAPTKPPKPRRKRPKPKLEPVVVVVPDLPKETEERVDQACSPMPLEHYPTPPPPTPKTVLPPTLAEAAPPAAEKVRGIHERLAAKAEEMAVRLGAYAESAVARLDQIEGLEVDHIVETCVRFCELDEKRAAVAATAAAREAELEASEEQEPSTVPVPTVPTTSFPGQHRRSSASLRTEYSDENEYYDEDFEDGAL